MAVRWREVFFCALALLIGIGAWTVMALVIRYDPVRFPLREVEGTFGADLIKPYDKSVSGIWLIRGDGNGKVEDGPNPCNSGKCGNDNIFGTDNIYISPCVILILSEDTISGDDSLGGVSKTGHDHIYGGEGNDTLDGEAGNDKIFGGPIVPTCGDPDEDVLKGGPGKDTLDGGAGDDLLEGGPGSDRLLGQEGKDLLLGGEDNDILIGGPGDDHLDGGLGSDTLDGGPGNDYKLIGGLGNHIFIFRAGDVEGEELVICTEHHSEVGLIHLRGYFSRDIPTGCFSNFELIVTDSQTQGRLRIVAGPGGCQILFK